MVLDAKAAFFHADALPAASGRKQLVQKVGDDFIVAGYGDDFDWLSLKLNEKLQLVQKARLGPGYDSEATVLHRCCTYSDGGLTWASVHRRAQAAPSRTHHWTTRNWTLAGREPTTECQQDWHTWRQTDPTSHVPARNAGGKATRADFTRLERIGRYLLHTPRAVQEFPLQEEDSIVTIDGRSDADAANPRTRLSTSGGSFCALDNTPLAT